MKKSFKFGAMALSLSLLMLSCEKEEAIKSNSQNSAKNGDNEIQLNSSGVLNYKNTKKCTKRFSLLY